MSSVASPERDPRWHRWLWVSLAVLVADQLTKLVIVRELELFERIPVLPFFDIIRLHNPGAAFSFLAGASGWQTWLFSGIAVLVSGGIVWWLRQLPPQGQRVVALGLALVLGGALGNLVDRLMYGYVVDFLLFFIGDWSWPAFNVADSAITCGVVLLLYDGLVLEPRRR
ncbi:MAG: lipoprotein signal peptidase [Chromatiales bacterium]|nr:lipoprotein signal peptidase [Chromatiales bacterium]